MILEICLFRVVSDILEFCAVGVAPVGFVLASSWHFRFVASTMVILQVELMGNSRDAWKTYFCFSNFLQIN